jgi:hypothetical protein
MRYLLPIILFLSACGTFKKSKPANMTEVSAPKAFIRQNESVDMGAELFQVQSMNIIGNRLYVIVKAHPILSVEDFDLSGSANISNSLSPLCVRASWHSKQYFPINCLAGLEPASPAADCATQKCALEKRASTATACLKADVLPAKKTFI